jgi:hypothetical protein
MKLYFGKSSDKKIAFVAEVDNREQPLSYIIYYCENELKSKEPLYIRAWQDPTDENVVVYDYGSHWYFFYLFKNE